MGKDTVVYTGKISVDELKKDLNKLLNEFLREELAKDPDYVQKLNSEICKSKKSKGIAS